MANVYSLPDHGEDHAAEHHGPTPRGYVQIGLILLGITIVEIACSFLVRLGFPNWVQVAILLTLAVVKGISVAAFFMHLRFDSRWFTFLLVAGTIMATFCVVAMIVLFSYKGYAL